MEDRDLEKDLRELRAELRDVGQTVRNLVRGSREKLSRQGEEVADQAKERWEDLVEHSREAGKKAKDYAEENPFHTAGIAALIGFFIGYMTKEHK